LYAVSVPSNRLFRFLAVIRRQMELVELIDHSFLIFENALQDLKLVLDVFDLFERDDVVRNTEWITSGLRRSASPCSFVLGGLSAQPLRDELLLES
jgi:hypothetical protein